MTNRIIKIKDNIVAHDKSICKFLEGEMIFGRGKKTIPFTDPFGNQSYRTEFDEILYRDKNVVPIGGYQFVFDKLFNIGLDQETTLRVGDLNDEAPQMKIGVPRGEYKSTHYNAETSTSNGSVVINNGVNISALNFVFGFMIGDGGSKEDNSTAIAPDYKNRSLYHPIPFRMSNDGYPMENGKYFGRVSAFNGTTGADPVTSYYIKKFDTPLPHIVHRWVTDNDDEIEIVDDTVFASTSSVRIESYTEINISVNKYDCRGYFTSSNISSRINEYGLVTGWYNAEKDDYESIRLFTHFTRPSIILLEDDRIESIYRIYAR